MTSLNNGIIKANKPLLFVHPGHELYGADKMLLLGIRAAREKYPQEVIVVILPCIGQLSEILSGIENVSVRIMKTGAIRKYDLKRFDFSALTRIFTFFRLIKYLNSFDLVYINTLVIIDFMLAARFCQAKVIIHVHEIPGSTSARVFSRILSFSRAYLIFISKASQKSLKKLKNKNQIILWNGVKQIIENTGDLRTDQKLRLLLIGRINSWKGQSLLIQAISLLQENDIKRLSVRIAGDVYSNQHHLKNELLEQINKSNLQDIIEILPFTSKPEELYNWSDIVVVPSLLPEPFGLVAIEAMSLGKLVIAAAHGGLTEIINDNVSGLLFVPGDANDLADKIRHVIHNPEIISVLGKKGCDSFNEKFTEDIYIKALKEII